MSHKIIKPPKAARSIIKFLLNHSHPDEVFGDLGELFCEYADTKGKIFANLWYWLQIFILIPPFVNNSVYWSIIMLKNIFVVSMRLLSRSKIYSAINIFGLSVGLAFALLVFLYVKNEYSYDKFHENRDSLYRVFSEHRENGELTYLSPHNPIRIADDFKKLYPEIENVVRFSVRSSVIRLDDNERFFNEDIICVDKGFFDAFSFPVLAGSGEALFSDLNSVVISAEIAEKYFPDQDPVGRVINIQNRKNRADYTVRAVFDNRSAESSIKLDILWSYETFLSKMSGFMIESYRANNPVMFIQLDKNSDHAAFESKLAQIDQHIDQKIPEGQSRTYRLEPIDEMYLNTNLESRVMPPSDPFYSFILSCLGILVLVIACINFMTLSIGRSLSRGKEVGVRKVIGAIRGQLTRQYLFEAIILAFLSLVISLLIASLFLPTFNEIAQKDLKISFDLIELSGLFVLTVITGFAAGIYPALFLSGFRPIDILRKSAGRKTKNRLSSTLVVVQFSISIFLIICTLVMKNQLDLMQQKNLGFDKERLIQFEMNAEDEQGSTTYQLFKTAVKDNPDIISIGGTSTSYGGFMTKIAYKKDDESMYEYKYNMITYDYLKAMGLELIDGRNFSPEFPTDVTQGIILNETAFKHFEMEGKLNESLPEFPDDQNKVIGVMKDFYYESLHRDIEPLVLAMGEDAVKGTWDDISTGGWPPEISTVIVRIAPGELRPVITTLEEEWRKISPDTPLEFQFLDDTIDRFYRSEQLWSRVINYAMIFAIGIACMGLFGLSLLAAERRIKEIGIRKVLGASVPNIVILVAKDMLILVSISIVIAWPGAYFAMEKWLEMFAFKTSIGLTVFAMTSVLALLAALFTISWQTIRAARSNPVNALKYE